MMMTVTIARTMMMIRMMIVTMIMGPNGYYDNILKYNNNTNINGNTNDNINQGIIRQVSMWCRPLVRRQPNTCK